MARIIVVDDEFDILHMVSLCLRLEKHEVETANSRASFLILFDVFKPDLVILDVMLNGDNGRDICKEIKAGQHRQVPVILYSALQDMLMDYQACGANAVLEKPFELVKLFESINVLLPNSNH